MGRSRGRGKEGGGRQVRFVVGNKGKKDERVSRRNGRRRYLR